MGIDLYLLKRSIRNLQSNIWWRIMPSRTIAVRWPVGPLVISHDDPRWADLGGAVRIVIDSADPNDHYRPWMEANVGWQGWDWEWDVHHERTDMMIIRFRRGKEQQMMEAAMRWS